MSGAIGATPQLPLSLRYPPDQRLEGFVGAPDWSEAERQRLTEMMRKAGFPACAKPEELAKLAKPVRLSECVKT